MTLVLGLYIAAIILSGVVVFQSRGVNLLAWAGAAAAIAGALTTRGF